MRWLSLLCATLTIVFGGWILFHLVGLVLFYRITIAEPSRWVSIPESVFTLALIIAGCFTWYRLVKGRKEVHRE